MKKIPDNAKLVFKGVLYDVYQWEQEMFDGSFSTFEGIKRINGASVVAVTDNMIIINNEEYPNSDQFISLPAGTADGEGSMLINAKRELVEETGYTSEEWNEWFISDILETRTIEWNNHFFIARNCIKTSLPKLDPGEKIETILLSFEDFLELRHNLKFRNKDFIPILEKAASLKEEKQKLKDLLGITT